MWKISRRAHGITISHAGKSYSVPGFSFDALFAAPDQVEFLRQILSHAEGSPDTHAPGPLPEAERTPLLAPVENQEIWAAGVTYFRSRVARMEESESSGGDRFYDLVYEAPRPELFFKATASRARGHLEKVRIRSDATWSVPEPEWVLAINSSGKIFGYTIGNDMSSRDIEGENPLYLPQAKVYRGSCAIGPCLTVCDPLPPETSIRISITRDGAEVFHGSTSLAQLKRTPDELAMWLFRENEFPVGAYLFTGTGIVPGGDFTLQPGDKIRIEIDSLGLLENEVE